MFFSGGTSFFSPRFGLLKLNIPPLASDIPRGPSDVPDLEAAIAVFERL